MQSAALRRQDNDLADRPNFGPSGVFTFSVGELYNL
jgi:hypothetical protein